MTHPYQSFEVQTSVTICFFITILTEPVVFLRSFWKIFCTVFVIVSGCCDDKSKTFACMQTSSMAETKKILIYHDSMLINVTALLNLVI